MCSFTPAHAGERIILPLCKPNQEHKHVEVAKVNLIKKQKQDELQFKLGELGTSNADQDGKKLMNGTNSNTADWKGMNPSLHLLHLHAASWHKLNAVISPQRNEEMKEMC